MRSKPIVLEYNSAGAVGERRQLAEHLEVLGLLDDFLAGEELEQRWICRIPKVRRSETNSPRLTIKSMSLSTVRTRRVDGSR